MKRIFLIGICVLFLTLVVSFSYAQMGGGMMGGQKGEMGKSQMMEQKEMMTPEETQKEMKEMADQMSEVMQKIARKMKDMTPDERKEMLKIMRDMSDQMHDMSMAMGEGWGKVHDMNRMKEEMKELQKRMAEMEGKK